MNNVISLEAFRKGKQFNQEWEKELIDINWEIAQPTRGFQVSSVSCNLGSHLLNILKHGMEEK